MKFLDAGWWLGISRVIAVEREPGGWRVLVMQKTKTEVIAREKEFALGDAALLDFLEQHKNLPVVLCMRGDFAFERLLDPKTGTANLVNAILGVNVENAEEFPFMAFPPSTSKGKLLAAVTRKNTLDEIINDCPVPKDRLIEVCFSEGVMAQALALNDKYEDRWVKLNTGAKSWFIFNGDISDSPGGQDYAEAGLAEVAETFHLPEEYAFLAGAALFSLLRSREEMIPHPALQQARQQHFSLSLMRNIASVGAVVLVIFALWLTAMRSIGENKKAELEKWQARNQSTLDTLRHLQGRVEARLDLKKQLGGKTLRGSWASWYSQNVAKILPDGVRLRTLVLWPATEDLKKAGIKDADKVSWDLILTGDSPDSAPLSVFMQALNSANWVNELSVVSSGLNYRSGGYDFVFLLKLKDV